MSAPITRRQLIRQLGFAGCAAALASCAPTPSPAAAPAADPASAGEAPESVEAQPAAAEAVSINWLGPFVPAYRYDYVTQVLLEQYKSVAPNVTIVAEQATSWPDTEEKIMVRYAAGGGPDLTQTYFAPLDFASRGMFAALNPLLEADTKVKGEMFYPSLMHGAQMNGETFGLPHNAITQVFFYNKKHFEAAGLTEAPQTLADVPLYAQKLSAVKEEAGFDFALQNAISDADTFSVYLYANGGSFVDDACQRMFYDDKMIETLQWCIDMVNSDDSTPFGSSADVPNGKAAMRVCVPILVGNTKTQFPEVYPNLGAALVPAGAAGHTSYAWAHYEHILANSKNKQAAWDFLAWMLSDPVVEAEFHDKQNFVPTQPRTYADPLFAEHWAWSVFAKQLELTKSAPRCITWRAAYTEVMTPELEAAWTGQKTPAEAVATMNEKLPAILGISAG